MVTLQCTTTARVSMSTRSSESVSSRRGLPSLRERLALIDGIEIVRATGGTTIDDTGYRERPAAAFTMRTECLEISSVGSG
jgi:hypothetical protein